MVTHEIHELRKILGHRWGLGRPLLMKELGMILRLRGPDPGRAVSRWESGARAQMRRL